MLLYNLYNGIQIFFKCTKQQLLLPFLKGLSDKIMYSSEDKRRNTIKKRNKRSLDKKVERERDVRNRYAYKKENNNVESESMSYITINRYRIS